MRCTFTSSANIPSALIVEDSKATCLLLAKVVAAQGWQTVSAQDGACALQLMATNTYDLVILDVNLRLLSGCEVVIKYREWEAVHNPGSHAAIVLMSGDPNAANSLKKDAFEHFILKPVSAATVTTMCKEVGRYRDSSLVKERVAALEPEKY